LGSKLTVHPSSAPKVKRTRSFICHNTTYDGLFQSHGQVQLARPNPWTTSCSVQREERASASYDQHMGWEAVGQRRTTTSARLKYATTAECRRAPCVNTSFRHSSGSHRGARLLRRFTQCECRWFLAHPSMRAARLPHVGQQARPARR